MPRGSGIVFDYAAEPASLNLIDRVALKLLAARVAAAGEIFRLFLEPSRFVLGLKERHGESVDRHAILQCVTGDLKSYSDLKPFLNFERKQTTAPEKLRNPAGHYRRALQKFYEAQSKRRDWNLHEECERLRGRSECAQLFLSGPSARYRAATVPERCTTQRASFLRCEC